MHCSRDKSGPPLSPGPAACCAIPRQTWSTSRTGTSSALAVWSTANSSAVKAPAARYPRIVIWPGCSIPTSSVGRLNDLLQRRVSHRIKADAAPSEFAKDVFDARDPQLNNILSPLALNNRCRPGPTTLMLKRISRKRVYEFRMNSHCSIQRPDHIDRAECSHKIEFSFLNGNLIVPAPQASIFTSETRAMTGKHGAAADLAG